MSHVTYHVSHVTCQVSGVTCHLSGATCQVSCVRWHVSGVMCQKKYLYIFFCCWQSDGANWWRVFYQRDLPRFVYYYLGPSPCNWRTMIHWYIVLTIFHKDQISKGLCKIVRSTFHCWYLILGLRSWKVGNYGTDLGQTFSTFSPRLEKTVHWNVILKILHKPWDMWSLWKIVGTTIQYIIDF